MRLNRRNQQVRIAGAPGSDGSAQGVTHAPVRRPAARIDAVLAAFARAAPSGITEAGPIVSFRLTPLNR
jgi:hypothetical protein